MQQTNFMDKKGEAKIGEIMYRHKMKVEHEMHGDISNNSSHRNSNKGFIGKFVSRMKKTFRMFITKYDYT